MVIAKWTYPNQGGPGRPPLPTETVQAVLRIARENPRVGAPGIVRRLAAIGITVSESSVRNILRGRRFLMDRDPAFSERFRQP